MHEIWNSLGATGEIALLLGVGFVLRRARLLSDAVAAGGMEFIAKIAIPAQILAFAASVSFSAETMSGAFMILLISLLGYAASGALGFLMSRLLHFSAEERAAAVGSAMFKNIMYMGFPLCSALLGPESVFYAIIPVILYYFLMFSFGVSLYSQGRVKGASLKNNPALICSALMLVMAAFQIRPPAIIQGTLKSLASVATPLSLVIIGMILADGDIAAVLKKRALWAASGFSLAVIPLLTLLFTLIFKPGRDAAAVLLTLSVLPGGAVNVIVAKQYGAGGETASQAVLHSTLVSLLVIPFGLPLLLQAVGYIR